MNITGPFFFVIDTQSGRYECGAGMYAVPKLYTQGSALSLVGRRNRALQSRSEPQTCAMVPVTIQIGAPHT